MGQPVGLSSLGVLFIVPVIGCATALFVGTCGRSTGAERLLKLQSVQLLLPSLWHWADFVERRYRRGVRRISYGDIAFLSNRPCSLSCHQSFSTACNQDIGDFMHLYGTDADYRHFAMTGCTEPCPRSLETTRPSRKSILRSPPPGVSM